MYDVALKPTGLMTSSTTGRQFVLRFFDCRRALLEETEQLALAVAWLRKQVGSSYGPAVAETCAAYVSA